MALDKTSLKKIASLQKNTNLYFVGGVIRDRLLNRSTDDYDLALNKNPEKIAHNCAKKLNGRAFVLDKKRGVYRVALKSGNQIDFAKFQGKDLKADLTRRDFSVNALAVAVDDWGKANWKKKIIDVQGGLKDLKKKTIQAKSPAVFKDDPLRTLRAFRISCELGFRIDLKTLKWIKQSRKLLKKTAPERIREECLRIFSTPNAYPTFLSMEKSGLLETFLPEVQLLRKTAPDYYGKGGVLKHTLETLRDFEDVVLNRKSWFPKNHKKIESYLNEDLGPSTRLAQLKWAAILHDFGKPKTAKKIGGRLRFFEHEHVGADMVKKMGPRFRWSSDETSRYARLVRNHMRPGNLATHSDVTDKAMHRFFRDLGDDAVGMLLVSLGDHLSYLTPKQKKKRNSSHELLTIKMINRFYQNRKKVLPPKVLNGNDIMKAFKLPPSKLIGALLKDLHEAQSDGNIKTKQEGLKYLEGRIALHQKALK